jgi:hypothetical protein
MKNKVYFYTFLLICSVLFILSGKVFNADTISAQDETDADSETALTEDETVANAIDIHATFHNVGVQVNISGDKNKNATASLEANITGAGFQTVHPLSKVYTDRFVGTVFSLPPETDVEVRVTISDPDGVSNGVQTASITTRSEQAARSTGDTIHVSKTGSDATGTVLKITRMQPFNSTCGRADNPRQYRVNSCRKLPRASRDAIGARRHSHRAHHHQGG